MLMQTKKPSPVDIQVGARIRLGRSIRNMSQEALGEGLGITFQQVQKYEKGTNRVGASRLSHIATILQQPIEWFFADVSPTEGAPAAPDDISPLLQSAEGIKLLRSYSQLKKQSHREAVHAVIATLTKQEQA